MYTYMHLQYKLNLQQGFSSLKAKQKSENRIAKQLLRKLEITQI